MFFMEKKKKKKKKKERKKLCLLISVCSRIKETESLLSPFVRKYHMNKYSLHLFVTTNMFVLELSKSNNLSKLNPTKGHQC